MCITTLLLLSTQLAPAELGPRDEAPPNIVLIVIDDLGWRDLASYGAPFYETPRIDELARQGTRFTNGYSNGPNCAPSRASLMTGCATPRHGIHTVKSGERGKSKDRKLLVPKNRTALRDQEWTLAEALATRGYTSAAIGKWHLGASPLEQGFDVNVAGSQAGHPKSYFSPYKNAQLPDGEDGEHLTARLTNEAISFIEAQREQPFFLYLSYFAVHTPIQGRPDLVQKYAAKKGEDGARFPKPAYAAMVEAADAGVGRVLDALERLELAGNTMVVLVSDNGGHGQQTSMEPLRGSKGMLYEGGIRVPMMARWPGHVRANATCDQPVLGSDWFATILNAARVEIPEGLELDSHDLMPLLGGELPPKHYELYWHFPAYLEGDVRGGDPWRTTPVGALRSGKHKLLHFFEDGRHELYDLEADPAEAHDLAQAQPELVAELAARLAAWRAHVGAEVPHQPNPEYAGR